MKIERKLKMVKTIKKTFKKAMYDDLIHVTDEQFFDNIILCKIHSSTHKQALELAGSLLLIRKILNGPNDKNPLDKNLWTNIVLNLVSKPGLSKDKLLKTAYEIVKRKSELFQSDTFKE